MYQYVPGKSVHCISTNKCETSRLRDKHDESKSRSCIAAISCTRSEKCWKIVFRKLYLDRLIFYAQCSHIFNANRYYFFTYNTSIYCTLTVCIYQYLPSQSIYTSTYPHSLYILVLTLTVCIYQYLPSQSLYTSTYPHSLYGSPM